MENKKLYLKGRQIRVWVPVEAYNALKKEAKEYKLTLMQYSGLKLAGFKIIKTE